MSTVADAINYADAIRPNTFPVEVKLGWVNDLEENIQLNIHLLADTSVVYHEDATEDLIVTGRFSLYWSYLLAMIDMAHGETSKYQNSMNVFNQFMDAYTTWYANTEQPGQLTRYTV